MRTARAAVLIVAAVLGGLLALRASRDVQAAPPAGKEIAEVLVSGNKVRATADIQTVFGLRPGQPYLEESIRGGIDRLYGKGWFTPNGIELRTVERPDGRINIILYVTELTNFIEDIQYKGAEHLNRTELDQLSGLRVRMPMSPHLNQQARLNILRKYQEMGRVHASVNIVEGTRLDDRRVIFDIVEGPVVQIGSIDIEFVGKHESGISAGRLKEQLTISSAKLAGFIGGDYRPPQIEYDTQKLTEYYHALGFLDARVSREIKHSDDHRRVHVTFFVWEGPRYKVGRVQISGNTTFPEKKLLEYTDLRENAWYDRHTISADLRRIRDVYGYTGRAVGVREEHPEPERGKGIVHVHYQVMETPQTRAGDVIIQGNTVTQDRVIRREIPIYPGQILSYPDLLVAEANLERLGIFKSDPATGVRPTVEVLDPAGDAPIKDVLVTVQETQTGSFLLGAGINSDAGITGSIVLNERNFDILNFPTSIEDIVAGRAFRGGGQEFRLEAVPGNVFQRYTASWRDPRFLDSLYSLSVSGYYYNRGFIEYNEDRIGARVGVGRRLDQFWSANVGARVEGVTVKDLPFDSPPDIATYRGYHFLAAASAGVRRDSRDSFVRPSEGSVFDFNYEQVFGDFTYPIVTAEYTSFWSPWSRVDGSGKHVLAFRTQGSWAGDDTPVYDRFYAGGFRSIRGFQFRGVGPHIGDYNTGGTFAFLNSLEYQIPVVPSDSLYVVGFIDSGTVSRSVTLADYRVTAGVGLRIAMPQLLGPVPLAIDFGFPLRDAPGDKRQVFSFWIGVFGQ
jgi:outer membrane protein assembly complex protein YaeT